jgi:hypothetical protein
MEQEQEHKSGYKEYCEGYHSFFVGLGQEANPYPELSFIVGNPIMKTRREAWQQGWDRARSMNQVMHFIHYEEISDDEY